MISLPNLTRRRDYALDRSSRTMAVIWPFCIAKISSGPGARRSFRSLLEDRHVFGFAARQVGNPKAAPVGFVLARLAAGEAEILTVAVARAHRRHGLGWRLMDAALRQLHADRAQALFLEVDETNLPALHLYRRMGFLQVGKRANYYEGAGDRGRTSALVMRRDLR